jgi:hypothetical protein
VGQSFIHGEPDIFDLIDGEISSCGNRGSNGSSNRHVHCLGGEFDANAIR